MYQKYKDIIEAIDSNSDKVSQLNMDRESLIHDFDKTLGGLRLPMRLRKRSGGMITWRNIARRGQDQRELDLAAYEHDLIRLPQTIREQLLHYEKKRILLNLNISLIQHEKKQLSLAAKKIDLNASVLESMSA